MSDLNILLLGTCPSLFDVFQKRNRELFVEECSKTDESNFNMTFYFEVNGQRYSIICSHFVDFTATQLKIPAWLSLLDAIGM